MSGWSRCGGTLLSSCVSRVNSLAGMTSSHIARDPSSNSRERVLSRENEVTYCAVLSVMHSRPGIRAVIGASEVSGFYGSQPMPPRSTEALQDGVVATRIKERGWIHHCDH